MKNYFIQLFDYDQYANHLILKAIADADSPKKPVELMAHLLGAQQVWLGRCKGEPAISGGIWPNWPAEQIDQTIDANHLAFVSYINGLNAADFNQPIYYKNSAGTAFENKLVDILAHVINHGTHHRAQIGQLLKFAGAEQLPATDYILYIRDK